MAWPTRTGLTTAKKLARALKLILQKYQELYEDILTVDQQAAVTAVIAALTAFIDNVPQYEPIS